MFRFSHNARAAFGLCRSLINPINKRCQSTTSNKVELEPNISTMSPFSSHIKSAVTNKLEILRPETVAPISMYQVLDSDGMIKDPSNDPNVCSIKKSYIQILIHITIIIIIY